jgi:UDP-N-acetylmuramoyl-L-alanyl-D-glutamate--2,6-diaminopimelate ligase
MRLVYEKILKIANKRGIKCVGYGYNSTSDIKITSVTLDGNNHLVKVSFFGENITFLLPLYGMFQIYNSICAAAVCYFTGVKLNNIVNALQDLSHISGRLELIANFDRGKVYLDYAHTPDALKNSILSLREYNPKRIITVFGCGGERDKQKREQMGMIAEKYSDLVIVTDDNPRSEDPSEIRKMIIAGCKNAKEIDDRKSAIEYAIDMMFDGDYLLVAGKGHENYQIMKCGSVSFSDKDIILSKVSKCK